MPKDWAQDRVEWRRLIGEPSNPRKHRNNDAKLEMMMMSVVADKEKMAQYVEDERHIREENVRLQRKLQMEIERREQLCRHLSESESSLEMDDERLLYLHISAFLPLLSSHLGLGCSFTN